jgi:hypothetical protein
MQWRVVVRISLTKDQGSQIRNNLVKPLLEGCGIHRTKTGTWESAAADPECAAHTLSELTQQLAGLAVNDQGDTPILNHLWIYIDRVTQADVPEQEVVV